MSTSTLQPTTATRNVETSRWRIDPARSSVEFRVPTFWGLMTVEGGFDRYDGTLDLAHEPAIELTIDADSLDTGNEKRDKHLRSSDFFDVENHPQVRFVSDSAVADGERLKVSGRLSAAGRSTPLELEASLREDGDELEVDARTHTDHRRLGMSGGLFGMIRSPAELVVHGRLVRVPD
jgi:polyisoprenoid-binding protein YceI